jgi:hypothetical protein
MPPVVCSPPSHVHAFAFPPSVTTALLPSKSARAGYVNASTAPLVPLIPFPASKRTLRNTTSADETTIAPTLDSPGAVAPAASNANVSTKSPVTLSMRNATGATLTTRAFASSS